ncbi:MAG: DNA adenine methylase [Chloroflexi bacterium]|nr:DNA adenine methylase [Chloroflexota bacterium]
MVQLLLIGKDVVNVASVPQRSPFRYPGGKTWLVPYARQWLASQRVRPKELLEPFAGGAIVGLTAVFENFVDTLTMVELDDQVAAVWRTVLSDDCEWLVNRITGFEPSLESVQEELARQVASLREKAFQTIVRNRVNRGGILAPGASLLRYGENGKGVRSRWYPETLKRRILNIHKLRHRIRFIEGDGMDVLRQYAARPDVVYFIDPPYTAGGKRAGTRLYTHNDLDHVALFRIAQSLVGDFLMTYDDAPEIRQLAQAHAFQVAAVAMTNTHHARMFELLIGRELTWTRSGALVLKERRQRYPLC